MKKAICAVLMVAVLVGFTACGKGEFTITIPEEYVYVEYQGLQYYYYYDEEAGIDRYMEIDYEQLSKVDQADTMSMLEEKDVDGLREWMFEGDDPDDLDIGYRTYGDYQGYYITFTDEDFHIHMIYILVDDYDLFLYGSVLEDSNEGLISDMESVILSARFE